ncbi:uncharacterized protein EI97DRAFT_439114 [Westerdykella ornata]|uniref:Uncharacterized protein n=1 Tax=Westerdykella ornata TaxID=318751 RepID=A0A6A6JYC8_WESOR|nr:uncharacterized protein EI97DRAFT_439114 [Westerdykella ornata]KAF2280029.1 hypothetical protein EI97DRAFT_439114 [Westerdykella ornata]
MNGQPSAAPQAAPQAALNGPGPSSTAPTASLPGNRPAGQNGQPPRPRRRRPPPDPMRTPYRPLKTIARPVVSLTDMNTPDKQTRAAGASETDNGIPVPVLRQEYLTKVEGETIALPLVMRRGDVKELRHHIMRLQSRTRIDIQDEKQFTQPIRLHRRDPRAPPSGAGSHFEEEETVEDLEEQKEKERIEILKEERRRVREENQAKIAPTGKKKAPAFQKKTEQKFRADDTPEAEKRRLLKYEETLPWHLEDFDNKQTWYGTYEAELSEAHVMLTTAYENGRDVMQIVPLERWYKFAVKGKIKQTGEQEEDPLKKEEKLPDFLNKIEQKSIKREQELAMKEMRRLRGRVGAGDDDEGAPPRMRTGDDEPIVKREADADDIDFNYEEDFADDEEGVNGLFEGEEADVKEAEEKLRRERLAAAAFDLRNEAEVYRQEELERQAAENARKLEKSIRKALIKREKNPDYDYRSDRSNPYESSSDDLETDSETERQRAKEEEERKAAEQNGKVEADKPGSGASTRGTNTPSGNHRPVDFNKKKRPGSPNLSEASGNESSRKKHKKKHERNVDGTRKSHLNDMAKRTAASGSDTEMTDAGRPKSKLKLKLGTTPSGTPGGSRAASPAAPQVNGSRAGSPARAAAAPQQKALPSALEIYKALPPEGMTITGLIAAFKGRVDKTNTQAFIKLVKAVSSFDKARSWLTPLPQMPAEHEIQSKLQRNAAPKNPAGTPSAGN